MYTAQTAAARIARELPELERTIDQAIGGSAALMQSMAQTRSQGAVPAATGQAAFLRLQKAQQGLIAAASEVQRVHSELSRINREIRAMPDENGECPWPNTARLIEAEVA